MTTLTDKLLTINASLTDAGLPFAFGGAIALAYCTGEPRATQDLDVNIFVGNKDARVAFHALPKQVKVTRTNRNEVERVGQTRCWWEETPIDLFFSNVSFHEVAANRVRTVPFAGHKIAVLDCTSLAVFKAMFNRTKDWADLEAMQAADQLRIAEVESYVADFVGVEDERVEKLSRLDRREQ